MTPATKALIVRLVDGESASRIGANCVIGYLRAERSEYKQLTAGRAPRKTRTPVGILVKEVLAPHPDAMSATGNIWQRSTEDLAPEHNWVWVFSGPDGPDVDHLCRAAGGLEKMLSGIVSSTHGERDESDTTNRTGLTTATPTEEKRNDHMDCATLFHRSKLLP